MNRDKNEENRMVYESVVKQAKKNWDNIAKPIDSLGLLEEYVVKLCAISGEAKPYSLDKRALVTMCADHGVVCEGVTQTGREVTKIVAENFAKGCSSVNYMSNIANVDVFTVDIGMATDEYPTKDLVTGAVINRKVARGTNNLAKEAAMTEEQCRQAIDTGVNIVRELKEQGYRIVATGEMGIGNTTPTSVLAAAMLHLSADEVTGRGAGLDDAGLKRKKQVIAQALYRVRNITTDMSEMTGDDIIRLLSEVGGYEIAGMTGVFLGGVKYHMPIVIDGAISAVAALAATWIDKAVRDYALASHVSEETAGKLALEEMQLEAVLHGHMCLGEGSGAVAVIPLLDMGMSVYKNMGTFADLSIAAYERSGKPREK